MQVWTLDPTVYGLPDYGLTTGQSRTFSSYLGDKGRTRFFQYNATAPIPVQCTFGWYGPVYAQFRQAWEDSAALAFGSNWMRLTLPVDFARGEREPQQYDAAFTAPFSASLAGNDYWKISMSLDVDASPALVLA